VTRGEAASAVRGAIRKAGYDRSVAWSGDRFEARAGPFASVAHVRGEVTDDAAVIHTCRGLAGGQVLAKCRELLARLFPSGGEARAE